MTKPFAFLVVPGFSLYPLTSALKAIRVANEFTCEKDLGYLTVTAPL